MTNEELLENQNPAAESAPVAEPEVIPSMAEFEDELNRSFHKYMPGDIVTGTVIGISDSEVTIDLGSYAEGIIKLEELSNDPRFSIKADVTIGETISATVLREDREGNLLLSRKQADDILAWDALKEMMNEKKTAVVKVSQAVNGGVVTYLQGIRAFIPASKLDVNYVEDVEAYVGKELTVNVITVDEANKKLVLSAKDVALEKALAEKTSRASRLPIGTVTTGTVEKIMPFGAFVNLGNNLSGLVHISQICEKRIKSPNEVIKVGEEVKVKILDVKDGKISLSIKAAEEKDEVAEEIEEVPMEYSSGEEAATSLGALLKGLKL
ncbi:MAG: S1 RNA-binding domain-containing protein [Lachnospiraceae bacterium]|nr:S1 RNA-binding domain-containing protein [Lachnospiraceae bacterium]